MSKTTFTIVPPVNSNFGRVLARDGVAAVVADAEALAAEREVAGHRADLLLGDDLVVDVELERPVGFAVLAQPLLGELDADDVAARRRARCR